MWVTGGTGAHAPGWPMRCVSADAMLLEDGEEGAVKEGAVEEEEQGAGQELVAVS